MGSTPDRHQLLILGAAKLQNLAPCVRGVSVKSCGKCDAAPQPVCLACRCSSVNLRKILLLPQTTRATVHPSLRLLPPIAHSQGQRSLCQENSSHFYNWECAPMRPKETDAYTSYHGSRPNERPDEPFHPSTAVCMLPGCSHSYYHLQNNEAVTGACIAEEGEESVAPALAETILHDLRST